MVIVFAVDVAVAVSRIRGRGCGWSELLLVSMFRFADDGVVGVVIGDGGFVVVRSPTNQLRRDLVLKVQGQARRDASRASEKRIFGEPQVANHALGQVQCFELGRVPRHPNEPQVGEAITVSHIQIEQVGPRAEEGIV